MKEITELMAMGGSRGGKTTALQKRKVAKPKKSSPKNVRKSQGNDRNGNDRIDRNDRNDRNDRIDRNDRRGRSGKVQSRGGKVRGSGVVKSSDYADHSSPRVRNRENGEKDYSQPQYTELPQGSQRGGRGFESSGTKKERTWSTKVVRQ